MRAARSFYPSAGRLGAKIEFTITANWGENLPVTLAGTIPASKPTFTPAAGNDTVLGGTGRPALGPVTWTAPGDFSNTTVGANWNYAWKGYKENTATVPSTWDTLTDVTVTTDIAPHSDGNYYLTPGSAASIGEIHWASGSRSDTDGKTGYEYAWSNLGSKGTLGGTLTNLQGITLNFAAASTPADSTELELEITNDNATGQSITNAGTLTFHSNGWNNANAADMDARFSGRFINKSTNDPAATGKGTAGNSATIDTTLTFGANAFTIISTSTPTAEIQWSITPTATGVDLDAANKTWGPASTNDTATVTIAQNDQIGALDWSGNESFTVRAAVKYDGVTINFDQAIVLVDGEWDGSQTLTYPVGATANVPNRTFTPKTALVIDELAWVAKTIGVTSGDEGASTTWTRNTAADSGQPDATVTGAGTNPAITIPANKLADWVSGKTITLNLAADYSHTTASAPHVNSVTSAVVLTSNGWREGAKVYHTAARDFDLAGGDSYKIPALAFGATGTSETTVTTTQILDSSAGSLGGGITWSVPDSVDVTIDQTDRLQPIFTLDDPGDWTNGDKFTATADMIYDGVTVKASIEFTITANWGSGLPVALVTPGQTARPYVFTPIVGGGDIIADLGAVTWSAPGGFDQTMVAGDWEYSWTGWINDDNGTPANPADDTWNAQGALADLAVMHSAAASTTLAAGNSVAMTDPELYPAGLYAVALKITPGGSASLTGPTPTASNETGMVTLQSDGWVKTKLDGKMDVELYSDTIAIGPTVANPTMAPSIKTMAPNASAGGWTTLIDASKIGTVSPTDAVVTWSPGTGGTSNGIWAVGGGSIGDRALTLDAGNLDDNTVKLEGNDWGAGDKVYLKASIAYHGVTVVLDDAAVITTALPFSTTSPTTVTPLTSSDKTNATGVGTPSLPFVLTPVQWDSGSSSNVLAPRNLSVMNWASGNASGTYNGSTAPTVTGLTGTIAYDWLSVDGTTNEGTITFNKPATPNVPNWALASIQFPDTKPETYTLKLKITSTEAPAPGNQTATITVRNNGWGTALAKDFFGGDTLGDIDDDAPTFSKTSATGTDETYTIPLDDASLGKSTATDIDGSYYAAAAAPGKLTVAWKVDVVHSDLDGLTSVPQPADVTAIDCTTVPGTISWDGSGDWADGGTIAIGADLTYDGVTVYVPEVFTIDVES